MLKLLLSGISGLDYIPFSSDLVFASGSTIGFARCMDVAILDDSISEERENFKVILTTTDSNVQLEISVTTININDNYGG